MNYLKIYNAFIESFKGQMFKEDEYTEVHHILPRYAGGTDDVDNLVRLSYKQHVFVHKLWWKSTGHIQAQSAYLLMVNIPESKKEFLCSQAGKIGGAKNRDSGHIQNLSKLYGSENGKRNVESGLLASIRHLAHNEIQRGKLRQLHERMRLDGSFDTLQQACSLAKKNNAIRRMQTVIENAKRDDSFLHKTGRGKYKYISPEGLEFSSASNAANYYGGINSSTIESWCKWNMAGWSKTLK